MKSIQFGKRATRAVNPACARIRDQAWITAQPEWTKLQDEQDLLGRILLRQPVDKAAGIELPEDAVIDHFFDFEFFDGWIA